MLSAHIDRRVLTDVSWIHWTLTLPLLAFVVTGHAWAVLAAIALSAGAGGYFYYRLRQIKPYPVQVRIAYVAWLAAGALPGMQWMHWIQLAGTTAMVTVGYCPLIRLLTLLPFNRSSPVTASLVWRAFVTEPRVGGLIGSSAGDRSAPGSCCSLKPESAPLACSLNGSRTILEEHHASTC